MSDKNYCYCVSGSPCAGITVVDNTDGTYTCPLVLKDGDGVAECEADITLAMKDKDGKLIFSAVYEMDLTDPLKPIPNIKSPKSVSGITLAQFITNYRPFLTGTFVDGGSFDFDLAGWASVNGCNGSVTFCLSFVHPRCHTNKEGVVKTTIDLLPPKARVNNEVCIGGVSGVVQFDLELKENDNTTALASPDIVRFDIKNGETVLETIEGVYGVDISTFTQVSGTVTSSITLWATGAVVDGGTIDFAKIDYGNANNFYSNDIQDTAKNLTICISAYDESQCAWNDNTDNSLTLVSELYVTENYLGAYAGSNLSSPWILQGNYNLDGSNTVPPTNTEGYIQGTFASPNGSVSTIESQIPMNPNPQNPPYTNTGLVYWGVKQTVGRLDAYNNSYQNTVQGGGGVVLRNNPVAGAFFSLIDEKTGEFQFNSQYLVVTAGGVIGGALASNTIKIYKGGNLNVSNAGDLSTIEPEITGGALIFSNTTAVIQGSVNFIPNDFGKFYFESEVTTVNGYKNDTINSVIIRKY